MLEMMNGGIVETTTTDTTHANMIYIPTETVPTQNYTVSYWNSWPIYITTDKTAKAIELLKMLQADKHIDVKSVPKFIELVEKIAKAL